MPTFYIFEVLTEEAPEDPFDAELELWEAMSFNVHGSPHTVWPVHANFRLPVHGILSADRPTGGSVHQSYRTPHTVIPEFNPLTSDVAVLSTERVRSAVMALPEIISVPFGALTIRCRRLDPEPGSITPAGVVYLYAPYEVTVLPLELQPQPAPQS